MLKVEVMIRRDWFPDDANLFAMFPTYAIGPAEWAEGDASFALLADGVVVSWLPEGAEGDECPETAPGLYVSCYRYTGECDGSVESINAALATIPESVDWKVINDAFSPVDEKALGDKWVVDWC